MGSGFSIGGNTVIFSAAHAWSANQTFNDNVKLLLGTLGADGELYSDGTDLFLNQLSGGDIMIAMAGSFPSPDTDKVHFWWGTAGVVESKVGAGITIESDGSAMIQFLTPDNKQKSIFFGEFSDSDIGAIRYHSAVANGFDIRIDGANRLFYTAGAFAFQEATTISTSAGLLTLAGNTGNSFTTPLILGTPGSLTIASGVVAITGPYHTLVVEGGAGSGADSLATATGGVDGQLLILKTTTSGANDQVTISDGTGADTFILAGGADFVMDHLDDRLELIHNGTEWVERTRSSNS